MDEGRGHGFGERLTEGGEANGEAVGEGGEGEETTASGKGEHEGSSKDEGRDTGGLEGAGGKVIANGNRDSSKTTFLEM